MDRVTLNIDGMTCGHCVTQVTKSLQALTGVKVGEVKVGSATVSFDPGVTSEDRITQAVEEQGYPVAPATR